MMHETELPVCCPNCGYRLGTINGSIKTNMPMAETAVEAFAIPLADITWPQHDFRIKHALSYAGLTTVGDLVTLLRRQG